MRFLMVSKDGVLEINDKQRKDIFKKMGGVSELKLSDTLRIYADGLEPLDENNCFVISNNYSFNYYIYGVAVCAKKRKRSLNSKEIAFIMTLLEEGKKYKEQQKK